MRAAFLCILCSLLTLSAEIAPTFLPADESFPLIRRDLVPLDQTAMNDLARQLTTLADTPVKTEAESLRERAQLLALILRLSPSQSRAREIEQSLSKKTFHPSINNPDLKPARDHSFATAKWLLAMPPESQGSRLGQLLLDVLSPFKKDDPLFKNHHLAGRKERWQGVIAPLTAFKNNKPKATEPTPPQKTPNTAKYLTTALLTATPLITTSPSAPNYGAVNISVILTPTEESEELSFKPKLKPSEKEQPLTPQSLLQAMRRFYEGQQRPLPTGYNIYIDTGKGSHAEANQKNILAPLAMILDSAVTGQPLTPDTLIFAKLEENGTLTRPAQSWPLLHALKKKSPLRGTRILVPPSLAEELTAMLVLEEPSLLLRFEFIACDTFSQARQLYLTEEKEPAEITQASKIFREITQALRQTSDANIASSLVYDSVKSRLQSASAASPRHLSANILLKQASGKRPTKLSTPMLARELHRLTAPLSKASQLILNNKRKDLKNLQAQQREILIKFRESRRIGKNDQPRVHKAIDLIEELRPIIRSIERQQITGESHLLSNWQKKVATFRKKLQQLILAPPQ